MRGGGWGPWYGGPWYDGYGYDVLLDDDESLADQIAKKVAQKQWAAGSHVGYVAPETHWYTVATPSAVKDEMDKIMREGNTLDQDINATNTSDPSYPAFKNAWLAFWLSYKKFYDRRSNRRLWQPAKRLAYPASAVRWCSSD
jgi:(2Fe-2S) ferredoxin